MQKNIFFAFVFLGGLLSMSSCSYDKSSPELIVDDGRCTATTIMVMVSNYQFDPKNVSAIVGDTIEWMWVNGDHTTTSGSIPSGASSWNSPLSSSSSTFKYVVTKTGTYNYVCTPHASGGMTGTISVVQPCD